MLRFCGIMVLIRKTTKIDAARCGLYAEVGSSPSLPCRVQYLLSMTTSDWLLCLSRAAENKHLKGATCTLMISPCWHVTKKSRTSSTSAEWQVMKQRSNTCFGDVENSVRWSLQWGPQLLTTNSIQIFGPLFHHTGSPKKLQTISVLSQSSRSSLRRASLKTRRQLLQPPRWNGGARRSWATRSLSAHAVLLVAFEENLVPESKTFLEKSSFCTIASMVLVSEKLAVKMILWLKAWFHPEVCARRMCCVLYSASVSDGQQTWQQKCPVQVCVSTWCTFCYLLKLSTLIVLKFWKLVRKMIVGFWRFFEGFWFWSCDLD